MAYDPEELVRLKHLLSFGERFLNITDSHDERITALENGSFEGVLYGTREHWTAQVGFVPAAGTIVIYSDYAKANDKDVPNFKVGDGNAYLVDLPFSQDDLRETLIQHMSNSRIHLSEEDRDKLESSISASVQEEKLVLS